MKQHTFTTKFDIGDKVFLNVAGSEQYLITNVYFTVEPKQITYELMASTGYRDQYTALEITSEKLIEV